MYDRRRSAFSLLELLVCLGMLFVVLGLLMPALARARAAARGQASANNLKKIAVAAIDYADNNAAKLIPFIGKQVEVRGTREIFTDYRPAVRATKITAVK